MSGSGWAEVSNKKKSCARRWPDVQRDVLSNYMGFGNSVNFSPVDLFEEALAINIKEGVCYSHQ